MHSDSSRLIRKAPKISQDATRFLLAPAPEGAKSPNGHCSSSLAGWGSSDGNLVPTVVILLLVRDRTTHPRLAIAVRRRACRKARTGSGIAPRSFAAELTHRRSPLHSALAFTLSLYTQPLHSASAWRSAQVWHDFVAARARSTPSGRPTLADLLTHANQRSPSAVRARMISDVASCC